jgi:predicted transcriptional regulator
LALDQKNTLAAMANVQRRSTSALIRQAIDCYIAQHAGANKLA